MGPLIHQQRVNRFQNSIGSQRFCKNLVYPELGCIEECLLRPHHSSAGDSNYFCFRIILGIKVGFGVVKPVAELEQLKLLDEDFDDGDLSIGKFRRVSADRYYYVIEDNPSDINRRKGKGTS